MTQISPTGAPQQHKAPPPPPPPASASASTSGTASLSAEAKAKIAAIYAAAETAHTSAAQVQQQIDAVIAESPAAPAPASNPLSDDGLSTQFDATA